MDSVSELPRTEIDDVIDGFRASLRAQSSTSSSGGMGARPDSLVRSDREIARFVDEKTAELVKPLLEQTTATQRYMHQALDRISWTFTEQNEPIIRLLADHPSQWVKERDIAKKFNLANNVLAAHLVRLKDKVKPMLLVRREDAPRYEQFVRLDPPPPPPRVSSSLPARHKRATGR